MTVTPHELLGRLAGTLRQEIGPAVTAPFARTQAFMASITLTKLARELATAEADARVAAQDQRAVHDAVQRLVGAEGPGDLVAALDGFDDDGTDAAWSRLVGALYAGRDELGTERFDDLLGIVRTALRARLDCALVYAS